MGGLDRSLILDMPNAHLPKKGLELAELGDGSGCDATIDIEADLGV